MFAARFAKQAMRAQDQHHGHDDERQNDRNLRKDKNGKGVEHRNQDGGDKRARDRPPHTADHHDHESLANDRQVHVQVCRFARDLQRPRQDLQARPPSMKTPENSHA